MDQRPILQYLQWASNAALALVAFGISMRVARGHMLWQDLLIFAAGLVMLVNGLLLLTNWRDEVSRYINYMNRRANRAGETGPLTPGNVRFNGVFTIVSGAVFALGALASMARA